MKELRMQKIVNYTIAMSFFLLPLDVHLLNLKHSVYLTRFIITNTLHAHITVVLLRSISKSGHFNVSAITLQKHILIRNT
jgi:hypothetical protein